MKQTLHIGILISSVMALLISICLYMFLYHDTLVRTEHAIVAKNAVADEGEREKQSKAILALASSTAVSRARLASFFVPADDAVSFIQAMESIGAASGATVSISSIGQNAADTAKKETMGTLTAHITVTGSWGNVMQAVELFEVLPYKVRINNLTLDTSIGSDNKTPAARNWQATFDISASTLI